MDDSDLYGAILYVGLYATFLLLSGKIHFGYVCGISFFGSIVLHTLLSLMSPIDGMNGAGSSPPSTSGPDSYDPHSKPGGSASSISSTLTFFRSASVLGYCFLPLVLTSLIGIVLQMDTLFGYLITIAAVGWCTYSSSGIFCAIGRMSGMRGLVAYPLALFYVGFGIMGIFSSRA